MSNMYPEFTTWNPIGGACWEHGHKCSYCYGPDACWTDGLKKKYSGKLRLWEPAFTSLGHGKNVFICSMSDLFARQVQDWQIERVLEHACKYDNTYLIQSKNPSRFQHFADQFPEKTILGTTIETTRGGVYQGISDGSALRERFRAMRRLQFAPMSCYHRMVSVEPVMAMDIDIMVEWIALIDPAYVSIGADSKNHGLPEPTPDELVELIEGLKGITEEGITEVRLKSNLARLLPAGYASQEMKCTL